MPYTGGRLMHHPFELSICALSYLSIWNMVHVLLNHPSFLQQRTNGFLALPEYLLWIWCVIGFIGATCMIIGLIVGSITPKGRMIESVGLWLSSSMWMSAAISDIIDGPSHFRQYGQYLAIALGMIARLLSITRIKHAFLIAGKVGDG